MGTRLTEEERRLLRKVEAEFHSLRQFPRNLGGSPPACSLLCCQEGATNTTQETTNETPIPNGYTKEEQGQDDH